MRFVSLVPAIVALFLSGAASAQSWDVYTNREGFFSANFPGTYGNASAIQDAEGHAIDGAGVHRGGLARVKADRNLHNHRRRLFQRER